MGLLTETELERDSRWMQSALEEAQLAAAEDEVPIGAVIVCNGKIIARAHNLTERLNDPTAHAEMQAITAACNTLGGKYLPQCTLYVTVEPCPMCAGALGWAQIGRVVYGAPDEKRGYRKVYGSDRGPFHPKTQLSSGVMAAECAEVITNFFRSKR